MQERKQPDNLERIFEEPAKIFEAGVEFVKKEGESVTNKKPFRFAEEYWNTLGPGLITGAADDDPSGIATYSQAGAQYGTQLLWLSWFSFPLMAIVQEMCARIGIVTGHGLAANIRRHYPSWTLPFITTLLFAANTFNIGADLGAMATGAQLLYPQLQFILLVCIFGLACLLLQIFTTYARYAKYLKYLTFVLFAYVFAAIASKLDWGSVFHQTVIPSFSFTRDQIFLICGILGTTISPYLFFWQSSQEVEEEHLAGRDTSTWTHPVNKKELKRMRADVWSGMFFSNIVMFFIIAACAGVLFTHGITTINTAAEAAEALRPFAGNFTYFLFTVGIVGTGLLAIPVLAGSTSYAIAESFNWKFGLYRKLKQAYAFYGVIIVSVLIGILINFIGLNPIHVLIYSAVANGIIAPVILFFIVRLAGNEKVMGAHKNGRGLSLFGWITIVLMIVAGVAAIATLFF